MPNVSTRLDVLINRLSELQKQCILLFEQAGENHYKTQYHNDLSPIGWHLGHCVYTENYWVKEAWLQLETCNDQLKRLYIPEFSKKTLRGESLPDFYTLKNWSQELQQTNIRLLIEHHLSDHHLAYDYFIIRFLIQHYAQHLETMQMVLQAKAISESINIISNTFSQAIQSKETITIPSGNYQIGNDRQGFFYDNELIEHDIKLDRFTITTNPVTNSDYLAFMNDQGYERIDLWPTSAHKWLHQNLHKHPFHWQKNQDDKWSIVTTGSSQTLVDNEPVYGINWYEASAYAKWSKARLPHEYEWEVACKMNLLEQIGTAWEWCSNTFHAYPDFKAYPYEGYSLPYFDNNHYVLKGGSRFTQEEIKRPSFRNYYEPDKRHHFAGLRLAYDK